MSSNLILVRGGVSWPFGMDTFKIKQFVLSEFSVNCYIVIDTLTKAALIIDAPLGVEEVFEFVKKHSLTVVALLLTHGHIDHIHGLGDCDYPCYIHSNDHSCLYDAKLNLSSFLGSPFTLIQKAHHLKEGSIKLAPFEVAVIHTPGHTPGSVSFGLKDILFSGDTLFYDSIGRTDFPGASMQQLLESIKTKLLICDERTKVFPGHGPTTTIEREKRHNPFLLTQTGTT